MDNSVFETPDIRFQDNLNSSFREDAITFGSCIIAGIGGSLLWGNIIKSTYIAASTSRFELINDHNATLAIVGLVGGLMMNSMVHAADLSDDDYEQEERV